MAFENLPNILNNMLKERQLTSKNFNVHEHHQRMLTTGPFADASKRHSVWKPVNELIEVAQVGFGGGGNTQADIQFKALEEDKAITKAVQPVPGIIHSDALRTADEIRKRIPPARKKAAPIDNTLTESEDAIAKRLGLK